MSAEERDAALAALQRGETETAIAQLDRLCQQDPNDYQAHLYLGAAYGKADRQQDAVRVLTRAVQLQPTNAQARYNLGVALERAGWPQEAKTALEQALALQPDYPKAQEALDRLKQGTPGSAVPLTGISPTVTPSQETPTVAMGPGSGASSQTPSYNPPPANPPSGYNPVPYNQPSYNQPPAYNQPVGGGQPQFYGSAPPTQSSSSMAMTTLVLGILGLVCCGLAAIAGCVTGPMELKAIREGRSPESGRTITMVGLGLSILGVIASIVISIFVVLWMMAAGGRGY